MNPGTGGPPVNRLRNDGASGGITSVTARRRADLADSYPSRARDRGRRIVCGQLATQDSIRPAIEKMLSRRQGANMTVQDIMTKNVQTCTPTTTLPQVVRLMREACCGIIPVIDSRGQVRGVVTDRDVSMALIATSRKPANVAAHEVMSGPVHACGPGDDVRSALSTMRQFKVRRLPVVSAGGLLKGIVSMDDFILRAVASDGPSSAEIISAMREILKPADEPLLAADVPL